MKNILFLTIVLTLNACANDYFYEYGKKVELTPINNPSTRSINNSNIKYYKTKDGRKIGIKNEIIVKLKKDIDPKAFFLKYNITNSEHLGSTTYLLKLSPSQNVFTLSQEMYNDNDTIYAVPNKIQKYYKR